MRVVGETDSSPRPCTRGRGDGGEGSQINMRPTRTSLLMLALLVATPGSLAAQDKTDSKSAPTKDDKSADKKEKKHRGKFTISRETTYVTGPLDRDGYIDYAAALNERLAKGVTPENNANVLLWKAIGPHPEGATMPPEFFKLMGIKAPSEKGDYFINLGDYIKDHLKIDPKGKEAEEIWKQLEKCTWKPWRKEEYPKLASWINANEKQLALVVEASKRSHYFSPLVPPNSENGSLGLIRVQLPGVQKQRGIATLLVTRAMQRAGQRKEDLAWEDLLACHRLGRLIEGGSTLIETLVGIAIEGVAAQGEWAFLGGIDLDAKEIESCLHDLQKLPPLPSLAEHLDLAQRFEQLDLINMADRHGIQYFNNLSDEKAKSPRLRGNPQRFQAYVLFLPHGQPRGIGQNAD